MDVRAVPEAFHGEAVAFAWRLCGQNRSRSYPLFPSRQALADEFKRVGAQPGGFQVGCYDRGRLKGVVFGFAEAENGYLQTTGFYVADGGDEAAEALAGWLCEAFGGYTANVGLPAENRTAAAALRGRGFGLLDDALELRLQAADFRKAATAGFAVRRIDEQTLPRYLDFHQAHFGDCYWNARRLRERFADWRVYALETGGAIAGGLFMRMYARDAAEIYGLYADARDAAAAVLSQAVGSLFADDGAVTSVLFMAEPGDADALSAALSLGFRQKNRYRCYAKAL